MAHTHSLSSIITDDLTMCEVNNFKLKPKSLKWMTFMQSDYSALGTMFGADFGKIATSISNKIFYFLTFLNVECSKLSWLIHSPNLPTAEAILHPWSIPIKIKETIQTQQGTTRCSSICKVLCTTIILKVMDNVGWAWKQSRCEIFHGATYIYYAGYFIKGLHRITKNISTIVWIPYITKFKFIHYNFFNSKHRSTIYELWNGVQLHDFHSEHYSLC
jgi:hypothetical protein